MNKVIKKITATAMAFTLLGTGTAVTNFIAPQFSNNVITASAANYGVISNYSAFSKPISTYNYGRYVGQSAGGGIYWIQAALNYYFNAGLNVDGQFGPATETAVKNAQRKIGVTADGIWGPNTNNVFNRYMIVQENKSKNYTVEFFHF